MNRDFLILASVVFFLTGLLWADSTSSPSAVPGSVGVASKVGSSSNPLPQNSQRLGMSGMSAEDMAQVVMMETSQNSNQDLRNQLKSMQNQNKQKNSMRTSINQEQLAEHKTKGKISGAKLASNPHPLPPGAMRGQKSEGAFAPQCAKGNHLQSVTNAPAGMGNKGLK